jgi:hypothetical protein
MSRERLVVYDLTADGLRARVFVGLKLQMTASGPRWFVLDAVRFHASDSFEKACAILTGIGCLPPANQTSQSRGRHG